MTKRNGSFKVGFHAGNVIMYLASIYKSVEAAICEMTQNMIDKSAKDIVFHVTLGDKRKNGIVAFENGDGATKEEMAERIGNIAACQKVGKIGHKGIGNLAPLAIASRYSMITRPKNLKPSTFFRIAFNKDKVVDHPEVEFDWEDIPDFEPPKGVGNISTLITVRSIEPSALKALSREAKPAEALAGAIAERFSARIEEKGICITVKVEKDGKIEVKRVIPASYPGRPEIIDIPVKDSKGKEHIVQFEMYITNKKVRTPQIRVRHRGCWDFDLRNMSDLWILGEDLFDCGYLQGVIHLDFCTLNADRDSFEWDDELMLFSEAIERFVKEHGKPFLKELADTTQMEEWTDLTLDVVHYAEDLLKDTEHLPPDLNPPVTKNHIDVGGPEENIEELHRTYKKKERGKREPDDGPRQPTLKPGKEKDINHPTVGGGGGTKRRKIRGQKGINVILTEGNAELGYKWQMRVEKGAILINTAHPEWRQAADDSKTLLRTYLSMLVLQAVAQLNVARVFPEGSDSFHMCFEDQVLPLWRIMAPPKPGRKATQ